MAPLTPLPIEDALPQLIGALSEHGQAVLAAPPGAGKTTRVPLAVMEADLTPGKIIMLEPRRLAARAAAARLAEHLGQRPGHTVGYRMRGEAKVSDATRIEVVTEGILTRMLQSDPELSGIGALIFDEIHERSIHADLGLALAIEVRAALRPDLILLPMSATLDPKLIADTLGGAPIITSEGRMYPVETRWRDRPIPGDARLDAIVAEAIFDTAKNTEGDILVFLPGEGDIRRVAQRLEGISPNDGVLRDIRVHTLFGRMTLADQQRALHPDPKARKVVLATAIAETSLTIEGVRVVIDAGRARRARFDPGSGMTRLVTERASRAEADQRRGRAGRTGPGVAYRLWTKGEEGGMAAFPPPEIETADLAPLALDLAVWGAREATDLALPTQPPRRALAEARALLGQLGAIGSDGAPTAAGRRMAGLPLHPRLARMCLAAGRPAAPLAALLGARAPLKRDGADLGPLLADLATSQEPGAGAVREEAKRIARGLPDAAAMPAEDMPPEDMLALAYPDRVAKRRPGDAPRYLLSGGTGAMLTPSDPLANAPYLVVADTDGAKPEPVIRAALQTSLSQISAVFAGGIAQVETCVWSERDKAVRARRETRLGALVLTESPWSDVQDEVAAKAMLDGLRRHGLTFGPAAEQLLVRAELARAAGADVPSMDRETLLKTAEDWLLPHLGNIRSLADWARFDAREALKLRIGWAGMQEIDQVAPSHWTTPLGRRIEVDYTSDVPGIALRLQELFGQTTHPSVAGQPLRLTLLSPAGRPQQVTMDLPGFWDSSYADVRKDMRGRYPKHPWPEDPRQADPTLRAKPRRG